MLLRFEGRRFFQAQVICFAVCIFANSTGVMFPKAECGPLSWYFSATERPRHEIAHRFPELLPDVAMICSVQSGPNQMRRIGMATRVSW